MRSLELFSGCGGLALGLKKAGFDLVDCVEFNKYACASLRENLGHEVVFEGDIRNYKFHRCSDIDLIAGGPPCQPFSLGGKHKGVDDRRDMFPFAIKAIQEIQPKAFIFENVKGLLRQNFYEYLDYIILRLKFPSYVKNHISDWRNEYLFLQNLAKSDSPEYSVQVNLLNAMEFGVPQSRERVFIVGFRGNTSWQFPNKTHSMDALLWTQLVTGEYWEKHQVKPCYIFDKNKKVLSLHKQYGFIPPMDKPAVTIRDTIGYLPTPSESPSIEGHKFQNGARSYPGHTGSFIDFPSKTIKAGNHGVPGGENMILFHDNSLRYFTTFEAKLIQTFPAEFRILGSWSECLRQIGNAVPVLLAETIGSTILAQLQKDYELKQ